MPGLRDILDAATPGEWFAGQDGAVVFVCTSDGGQEVIPWREGVDQVKPADARLIAFAPELAALCLDMGEALLWTDNSLSHVLAGRPHRAIGEVHAANEALLARLDRIGKEPGQ